jgi:para-nitrobenzyl esterase
MNFRLGALGSLYAPELPGVGSTNLALPDVGHNSGAVAEFVRGGEPWERYDGVGGSTMLLGPEIGIARGHRAT